MGEYGSNKFQNSSIVMFFETSLSFKTMNVISQKASTLEKSLNIKKTMIKYLCRILITRIKSKRSRQHCKTKIFFVSKKGLRLEDLSCVNIILKGHQAQQVEHQSLRISESFL